MAVILLIAVVAGYLTGGRLRNLARLRMRGVALLGAALVIAVAAKLVSGNALRTGPFAIAAIVVSLALVGAFLAINIARAQGGLRVAVVLMTLGWLLNAAAIIVNGHMASPAAVLTGHHSAVNTWIGPHLAEHDVLGPNTRLPWLSDAMVVHVPGYLISLSLGDLILAAGVVVFIVQGMRPADDSTKGHVASRWTAHP
jgi:hypothetical protein